MASLPKPLLSSIAAILLLAGCGGSEGTTTVIERTVVQQAPAANTATESAAAPAPKPKRAAKPKPAPKPKAAPATAMITVPNVVGHNHQAAQNEMQAAGLYMLDEQDATGQGRMLIWDRNWVVVSQDPPAGSQVSEDTTVTLSSKKIGE